MHDHFEFEEKLLYEVAFSFGFLYNLGHSLYNAKRDADILKKLDCPMLSYLRLGGHASGIYH